MCSYMYVFMQVQKIGGLDVYRVTNVLMACQDYMKKIDVRDYFVKILILLNLTLHVG